MLSLLLFPGTRLEGDDFHFVSLRTTFHHIRSILLLEAVK